MYQFLELSNLEKFYTENPDSVIFAFLAFRNLEQGNADRALSICEKGVEKYPEYPFGHFILGYCYYHLKDFSKAKTHLEIALAYDEKNPQAWKLLGEINEQFDLSIQAEECNLKYYLLDSFNPDALEKYQKEEIIDFGVFNKETDLEEAEKPGDGEGEKSKLDKLFEKHLDQNREIEMSEDVDHFFKETIEDISDETEPESPAKEGDSSTIEEERKIVEADVEEESIDSKSVVKDIISEKDREESGMSETDQAGRPSILTPTIGEIYIAQGRFEEAVGVFEKLLEKEPDNQKYRRKIGVIKKIISNQKAKSTHE